MRAEAERYDLAAWKSYTHVGDRVAARRRRSARRSSRWSRRSGRRSCACTRASAATRRDVGPGGRRPSRRARSSPTTPATRSAWWRAPTTPGAPNGGVDRLLESVREAGIGPGGNVYAELGSTWRNLMGDPDQAAHLLGQADRRRSGPSNVLWGTDSIWYGSPQDQIEAFRAFEITAEAQERFGYAPLTRRGEGRASSPATPPASTASTRPPCRARRRPADRAGPPRRPPDARRAPRPAHRARGPTGVRRRPPLVLSARGSGPVRPHRRREPGRWKVATTARRSTGASSVTAVTLCHELSDRTNTADQPSSGSSSVCTSCSSAVFRIRRQPPCDACHPSLNHKTWVTTFSGRSGWGSWYPPEVYENTLASRVAASLRSTPVSRLSACAIVIPGQVVGERSPHRIAAPAGAPRSGRPCPPGTAPGSSTTGGRRSRQRTSRSRAAPCAARRARSAGDPSGPTWPQRYGRRPKLGSVDHVQVDHRRADDVGWSRRPAGGSRSCQYPTSSIRARRSALARGARGGPPDPGGRDRGRPRRPASCVQRVAMGAASLAEVDARGRGPGHHLRDPGRGGPWLGRLTGSRSDRRSATARTREDRVEGRGDGGRADRAATAIGRAGRARSSSLAGRCP